jgi:small-conductance mechanosensitive channel
VITTQRNWLLALLALLIATVFFGLARLFGKHSETLLAPFIRNVMLRAVVGSLLSSLLIFGGLMLGLSVLGLTKAVLSIVGVAGVIGLAVGFAFKDIAENFIASLLLGVRRPFRIGDYIQVAGQAGVVLSMNTRATVLVTLEGNHIRIPNNVIYKEILTNSSASATSRAGFDVLIPYQVSTATALDAITKALKGLDGLSPEPPPRALVSALEPSGVRLRAFFWTPTQGVDGDKLQSDAKLKVKVALQEAGIVPPATPMALTVVGRVPVEVAKANGHATSEAVARPGAVVTPEQAEANLRNDSCAAKDACAVPGDGQTTPMEHVLKQAENHVSEEGTNLLATNQPAHT